MYLNIYYEYEENTFNSYLHIFDDTYGYKKIPYTKIAYKLDPSGDYTTLYGQKCKLIKRWKKEDVESGIIFESDVNPEMRYLVDNYMNSEEPSPHHVVFNFDIEVSTIGGLSEPMDANNEITSIAFYDYKLKQYTVHLLDEMNEIQNISIQKDSDVINIKSHTSEKNLLIEFMQDYKKIRPTIITGWNSDMFDIPYLYNRLKNVFGLNIANELSPVGIVTYDLRRTKYKIAGVSSLDMMKLYKNFTFGERTSYSLDAIAKIEVGEGKIKYNGTLDKLYAEDKEKFIDYNVHDVRLVKMIDEKMKFIDLAKGIAYKGHVPLEDVYFSSIFLDGAILTYLKRKGNIVAPNKPNRSEINTVDGVGFEGAYVKDPIPGLYKWIIDYDFQSLYPSIIRTINISPETKMCKIKNWKQIQEKFDIKM